jgi:methylenetetrahydrofolate dehydrogenase (NADP+)/methenyltetrahydrofolate cyclohydrolase
VSLKEREASADGIAFRKHLFPLGTEEQEVVSKIAELNDDATVHGILVQLPLPKGFDADRIVGSVDPEKDADGFHARNISAFLAGDVSRIPVFPEALIEALLSSEQPLREQSALLVVNSEHFGRVMLKACENQGLVGRILPSERLLADPEMILEARVIVSACGIPGLIRRVNVLPNSIVIDGGIAKDEAGKTVGDIDGESISGETGFLSPVPGGVGPITIACLLRKVVALAEEKQKSRENGVSP